MEFQQEIRVSLSVPHNNNPPSGRPEVHWNTVGTALENIDGVQSVKHRTEMLSHHI